MLIAFLLPFIGGFVLANTKFKSSGLRLLVSEMITCATSLFVIILAINGAQAVILERFTENLILTFGTDPAGKVFLALIAVLWPLAILYTCEYMEHEERPDTFLGFYIMTYGVMVLLCCARTLFTLYIVYELLTLVTLPLVWHKKDRDSIHAARDYVRYSIGAAAMGFICMVAISFYGGGSFNGGAGISENIPMTVLQIAYLMGFFGFGVKATVFPLSAWLPRACAAPTPVTALLHAVAVVNAGIFSVLRLTFYVFDPERLLGTPAQVIAIIASICTVLYGAIMAVRVRHVKRKLAFSTISNLGYMLLGISLMTTAGMTGAMMHMVIHSIMKITLFFCIGAIMCKTERFKMSDMHGLAHKMPAVFCVFVFGAIALMGIPPLAGFVSKFYLITASVEQGTIWSYLGAGSLLISAILTAVYSLSVLVPAFALPMNDPQSLPDRSYDPSWRMLLPMFILVVLIIVIGIHPQPIYHYIQIAASTIKEAL